MAFDQVKLAATIGVVGTNRDGPHRLQCPVQTARKRDDQNIVPRVHVKNRNIRHFPTHRVNHTWKERPQCNKPRYKGPPIDAVRVPINTAPSLEEMGNIDSEPVANQEIVNHHNACRRSQEERVRSKESEKRRGLCLDFPRTDGKRYDGADELPAADVDVFGEETRQIVGQRDRVSGHIGHDVEESEKSSREEFAGPVVELVDYDQRVPFDFSVEDGRGDCHCAAEELCHCDKDGQSEQLGHPGCFVAHRVARDVHDVDGEGGIAGNRSVHADAEEVSNRLAIQRCTRRSPDVWVAACCGDRPREQCCPVKRH